MIRILSITITLLALCLPTSTLAADQVDRDAKGDRVGMTNESVSECVAIKLYTYRAGDERLTAGGADRTTPIPAGWKLLGAGGTGGDPVIVVCR